MEGVTVMCFPPNPLGQMVSPLLPLSASLPLSRPQVELREQSCVCAEGKLSEVMPASALAAGCGKEGTLIEHVLYAASAWYT